MAIFTLLSILPFALANPPGIPSAPKAESQLAGLTVASGYHPGYDRDLFPHWITRHGCTTRETVLRRDGANVKQGSSCAVTSGTWHSPYDGDSWAKASDVDIDHVVPLSNAWKSGASQWTTSQRKTFANDLGHPQLLVVTDNVNQQKGDAGPEEWKPPLSEYSVVLALKGQAKW